jgi:hypothetical protein
MSSRIDAVDRCRTCNHKREKHFWPDETAVRPLVPSGNKCTKNTCHCDQYRMQAPEIVSSVKLLAVAFCVIIAAGFIVSSMHLFDSPGSNDSGQCTIAGPRGTEPC